jgi:hypothetical protein
MPFVIGEVEVVNEVSLAPSAVLYDGAVVSDGDLTVKVNQFFYDLAGTKGKYLGAVGQAVADNLTNYVYLDGSAALVINSTGYPGSGTAHIRLARVIASGGIIVRVVLERAFFTSGGTSAGVVPDDSFVFGAGGVGTSTTARYLVYGYTPNTAPVTSVAFRAPRGGTASNLRVRHNGTGVGGNIGYTLVRNGVATALTCTVSASGSAGSDLVNTVTVAADDLLELKITKASSISTSPSEITATIEFNS